MAFEYWYASFNSFNRSDCLDPQRNLASSTSSSRIEAIFSRSTQSQSQFLTISVITCHNFVFESSVYRSNLIWARELWFNHFLTVLVLRLSRKCDHPAFSLCLQFIRRTCAGKGPFSAVAAACSPCARAPRSRPLPLAPLTFRLASLPPSPSLRTIRRQRAAVMSHPSGNYDHWDKWDKSGWVRISRISRIRSGPPQGTYPEKGVLILNTYPNGIS